MQIQNWNLNLRLGIFLAENPTPEQEAFGKEAIKAKCENSDVDFNFAESLIYILPECLDEIVFDLILTDNGKFSKVMEQFVGHSSVPDNYNWFIMGENSNGTTNASATTSPTVGSGEFVKTIIYKDNTSAATDLSMAKMIIHESFHAYLVFVYKFQNIDKSYKNLLDKYALDNSTNANDTHHGIFIQENVISEIAEGLKEYGENNGYNLSPQYYQDMAWGGLTHIEQPSGSGNYIINPAFDQVVPNNSDQQRIINRLNAEKNNQSVNGIQPEGAQACP